VAGIRDSVFAGERSDAESPSWNLFFSMIGKERAHWARGS